MVELLATLGATIGGATLLTLIGIFIKIGGVNQEIVESRKDIEEIKADVKTHANNLQQVREDVASIKGSRSNTGSHVTFIPSHTAGGE